MKILCLCFYFKPDLSAGSFKNTALVDELARQVPEGSQIDVITTLPNRYSSFSVDAEEEEISGSVRIRRIGLPAHQSGMVDQSKSFATYATRVLRLTAKEDYDLIYASSSRLMMSILGGYVSWRKKRPFYLDIRDIFVDTIKDVLPGKITMFALPVFSRLEKWAVRRAARVNVVSDGFVPYFQKQFPGIELSGFTNGIDQIFLDAAPTGTTVPDKSELEVLYAGNMGEGQGLHHIIPPLAKRFEGRLRFRLVGGGGRLDQLKEEIRKAGCTNVILDEPVNRDELLKLYANADILFLHLNDYDAFKKVLPSKIFEYGALGKPLWAGVSGFSADFIRKNISNSAVFHPCDVDAADEALQTLEMKTERRSDFIERFSRARIIERMASEIIATGRDPVT
ncbi:glycosyltransferase family 4 protein [Marinobacter sp.]|uniref:glycosyltransferase family 4 protein n=1 Tax=Marinobacter sp. TaxID=50741 RepID=UPI00384C4D4A